MQEGAGLSETSERKTTAYHPQTNGPTNSLDETLTDMLSIDIDVKRETWAPPDPT